MLLWFVSLSSCHLGLKPEINKPVHIWNNRVHLYSYLYYYCYWYLYEYTTIMVMKRWFHSQQISKPGIVYVCVCICSLSNNYIMIIKAWQEHGFPWFSLTIHPYYSSLSACPQNNFQCLCRADEHWCVHG